LDSSFGGIPPAELCSDLGLLLRRYRPGDLIIADFFLVLYSNLIAVLTSGILPCRYSKLTLRLGHSLVENNGSIGKIPMAIEPFYLNLMAFFHHSFKPVVSPVDSSRNNNGYGSTVTNNNKESK